MAQLTGYYDPDNRAYSSLTIDSSTFVARASGVRGVAEMLPDNHGHGAGQGRMRKGARSDSRRCRGISARRQLRQFSSVGVLENRQRIADGPARWCTGHCRADALPQSDSLKKARAFARNAFGSSMGAEWLLSGKTSSRVSGQRAASSRR